MSFDFFPEKPEVNPRIYAYEDTNPQYKNLIKIGFTNRSVKERVREQYPTIRPGKSPFKIILDESAMRNDGTTFYDHDVFKYLKKRKFKNPAGEWFRCNVKNVKAAILALKNRQENESQRIYDFKMRPEQILAVKKASNYFRIAKRDNKKKTPHFLWNAKMRFGKTFATYQLAKKENWKRILI